MNHDPASAELIARVFTEHIKLAGEYAQAPAWLVEALGEIQQTLLYTLQRADEAAKRMVPIAPKDIRPDDILVAPKEMKGKVALCLSERPIDMPHCYALFARPNPACSAWQDDSIPKLVSELLSDKGKDPNHVVDAAYLVDIFKEAPGDFSRTRHIAIDAEAQWELQRQLSVMGVQSSFFSYLTLIKYGEDA
jgi:hypothetical protein